MAIPNRIPPSLAALLGVLIGVGIGMPVTYFWAKDNFSKVRAEAELGTVMKGTKAAERIHKDLEIEVLESKKLTQKVESGELKITSKDGRTFTSNATLRLLDKVSKARAFSD